MECQKVKCKADCRIKIGQSQLNMQAILQYFLSLLRSYQLEVIDLYIRQYKREKNINVFMKKVIPRSVRLIWSAEK